MRHPLDGLPELPVARVALRESRLLDIEVRGDAVGELDTWGVAAGDVVEFPLGLAPVEPLEGAIFVLDDPARKGAVLTVRLEGPNREEGRVCSKRLVQGTCFTIQRGKSSDFTVHRNITVEGSDLVKLHFAHGGQLLKLRLAEGDAVSIKEKPCGIADFELVEAHTQDLNKCPNCRTGMKGPRTKDFNAADLCAPGTQYALVRPKERPRRGFFLVSERDLPSDAYLRLVMKAADRPPEPKMPEETSRRPGRASRSTARLQSRSRRGGGGAPRLQSRSRRERGREESQAQVRRRSRSRGTTRPRSRSRSARATNTPRGDFRAVPPPQTYSAVPPPRCYSETTPAEVRRTPSFWAPTRLRSSEPRGPSGIREGSLGPTVAWAEVRAGEGDAGLPAHSGDDWEIVEDDKGSSFYHHIPTGHTQWEPPEDVDCRSLPQARIDGFCADEWEIAEDSEGNVFYHHTPTGHTQWEPPYAHSGVPVLRALRQTNVGVGSEGSVQPEEGCTPGERLPAMNARRHEKQGTLDGLFKRAASLGIPV